LAKEHPQTIALILSQLDPRKTMAILDGLGETLRNDVLYRIGSLNSVRVATLRSLEEALSNELRSVATGQVEVGGAKAVAEALKHSENREEWVGKLRERDAELAGEVSKEMGEEAGKSEDQSGSGE
jgi:flagellar motor switch protein FliG